jgi:hypothetical protein
MGKIFHIQCILEAIFEDFDSRWGDGSDMNQYLSGYWTLTTRASLWLNPGTGNMLHTRPSYGNVASLKSRKPKKTLCGTFWRTVTFFTFVLP